MKVLLFANSDWYLYNFRLALAQALQEQGYQVVLLSPPGHYVERLQSYGFHWIRFQFSRRGLNIFREGITIFRLFLVYWKEKPDIVHHFTIKCVLYGSFVSKLVGICSVINAVTGLGYVFSDGGWIKTILRSAIILAYRFALPGTRVIFQNLDDQNLFLRHGLVQKSNSIVIPGSGVDIERFQPEPENEDMPIVVFPGRLLWDKGVGEFIAAAQILQAKNVIARFVLVGNIDHGNPSCIPPGQLQEWVNNGSVEYWGWHEDMENIFNQAHVVCLPSYHEGLPKVLIEAAASGRAIVTTNQPGCREIVQDGINGLLIPPRDSKTLAKAIRTLLENSTLRQQMGSLGRQIAVEKFSVDQIVSQTLAVYHSWQSSIKEGLCQH